MTGAAKDIAFRRPVEPDYARLVDLVDEWWGGRRMRLLLPRLWLQHFGGTSWIAERGDGRVAGFLIGFISQDHPDTAYVHMVATNPNGRRSGLGNGRLTLLQASGPTIPPGLGDWSWRRASEHWP